MKSGTYTIFQFNGKDCFLQADDGSFEMLSYKETPEEIRENPVKWSGRKLTIDDNMIELLRTSQEIQEAIDRRQRHLAILRDISGIEEIAENHRPQYVKQRLTALRRELAEYENLDPTAITLEQKRANESIDRSDR